MRKASSSSASSASLAWKRKTANGKPNDLYNVGTILEEEEDAPLISGSKFLLVLVMSIKHRQQITGIFCMLLAMAWFLRGTGSAHMELASNKELASGGVHGDQQHRSGSGVVDTAIAPVEQEKVAIAEAVVKKQQQQRRQKAAQKNSKNKKKKQQQQQTNQQQPAVKKIVETTILDTSNWAQPSKDYKVLKSDLWEIMDDELPNWMKQYFRFHKEQTTNRKDWWTTDDKSSTSSQLPKDARYLYVTCHKDDKDDKDGKCGSLADRLLTLPFLIKVAAKTKRILLFQWTKPSLLENFLVPPMAGIDWRVPDAKKQSLLLEQAAQQQRTATTQKAIVERAHKKDIPVVRVQFVSSTSGDVYDYGSIYYDSIAEQEHEPDFQHIFHKVWKLFFTPAPALAAAIQGTFHDQDLVPGEYVAAHVRALYNGVEARDDHLVTGWTKNAVACAVQVSASDNATPQQQKAPPLYFASDVIYAAKQARQFGKNNNLRMAFRGDMTGPKATDPLPLDDSDQQLRPASDYYNSFIDLYLLAYARCRSYGLGGYGRLANYLSETTDCSKIHMNTVKVVPCQIPKNTLRRRIRGLGGFRNNNKKKKTKDITEMDSRITNVFLPPMEAAAKKTKKNKKLTVKRKGPNKK